MVETYLLGYCSYNQNKYISFQDPRGSRRGYFLFFFSTFLGDVCKGTGDLLI